MFPYALRVGRLENEILSLGRDSKLGEDEGVADQSLFRHGALQHDFAHEPKVFVRLNSVDVQLDGRELPGRVEVEDGFDGAERLVLPTNPVEACKGKENVLRKGIL